MRKIIAVLLVLAGFVFFLMKRGEQVALNSIPQNTLVVFSKTGCPHCHDALAFIDETIKKQYPTIPVTVWNVDNDNNLARLLSVAKHYRIPTDRLGTPVLLYNGKILIGWGPNEGQKLLNILKSHPIMPNRPIKRNRQ